MHSNISVMTIKLFKAFSTIIICNIKSILCTKLEKMTKTHFREKLMNRNFPGQTAACKPFPYCAKPSYKISYKILRVVIQKILRFYLRF